MEVEGAIRSGTGFTSFEMVHTHTHQHQRQKQNLDPSLYQIQTYTTRLAAWLLVQPSHQCWPSGRHNTAQNPKRCASMCRSETPTALLNQNPTRGLVSHEPQSCTATISCTSNAFIAAKICQGIKESPTRPKVPTQHHAASSVCT